MSYSLSKDGFDSELEGDAHDTKKLGNMCFNILFLYIRGHYIFI
ncbi:hypothetical protein NARC_30305 [Candidatus Nitrosocosmicus arcticus]|uniref:Uncharacterized protein n=1 Tax=Candidatus Nitrosocosmicus arcticus TaxID=2035267 RepID=A0A557SYA8_9ARCH|nr:hypothetical protein NARC_30305 [Candidatus Nitrosocosmicus arcticus]